MSKVPPRVRDEVFARSKGRCVCGCGQRAVHAHHVWPVAREPELAGEPDAIVAVALACHFNHHAAYRRLPRAVIWRAERLATTGPRQSYLDRCYGV